MATRKPTYKTHRARHSTHGARIRIAFIAGLAALACCALFAVGLVTLGLVQDPQTAVAQAPFEGKGTKADPYLIKDAKDLKTLADKVCGGTSYTDTHFKLAADIDLAGKAGHDYVIGKTESATAAGKPFEGVFDGDGHSIKNLDINAAKLAAKFKNPAALGVGLFSSLSGNAVVKNLTLHAPSMDCTTASMSKVPDLMGAGAIAGISYAAKPGTTVKISNCKVTKLKITADEPKVKVITVEKPAVQEEAKPDAAAPQDEGEATTPETQQDEGAPAQEDAQQASEPAPVVQEEVVEEPVRFSYGAILGISATAAPGCSNAKVSKCSATGKINADDAAKTLTGGTYSARSGVLTLANGKTGTASALATQSADEPELSTQALPTVSGQSIFVDYENGDDANPGTVDKPIKTIQQAYKLITVTQGVNDHAADNRIYFMSDYTDNDYGLVQGTGAPNDAQRADAFNKPATLSGVRVSDEKTQITPDPSRILYMHSKTNASFDQGKMLFAATAIEDITLSGDEKGSITKSALPLYCQCNDLTIGLNVTMEGYQSVAAHHSNNPSEKGSIDVHIFGGYRNWNRTGADNAVLRDKRYTIHVMSGEFSRILAGSRTSTFNSKSKNVFGDTDNYVHATIIIDMPNPTASSGNKKYDVANVFGGQTDGTFYGVSNVEFTERNRASVGILVGANESYDRANAGNDFIGTTSIDMKSGTAQVVYGGCLGRFQGSDDTTGIVNARFLSNQTIRQKEGLGPASPDISVRIGPNATVESNIFGAGAGGLTGPDPADPQTKEANVSVSVDGATINGSVYGAGSGYSPVIPVSKVRWASPDAGKLIGNSSVSINGGTIKGSVYGAGAGTREYKGKESLSDLSKLAQMRGNARISISGGTINGSVYGASQGFDDMPDMAKLFGNTSVYMSGGSVGGSMYGAGAYGHTEGTSEVRMTGGTIGASVYGGGQGKDGGMAEVGMVSRAASVSIEGGTVDGNVFCGGENGFVGNPNVTTSAESPILAPCATLNVKGSAHIKGSAYGGGKGSTSTGVNSGQVYGSINVLTRDNPTIDGFLYGGGENGTTGKGDGSDVLAAATINVTMAGGSVGKSVFGGGQGSRGSSVKGALYGNTLVNIYGGSIGQNVFGGGNESRVYAPSEDAQATKVVLNSTAQDIYVTRSGESSSDDFGKVVSEDTHDAICFDTVHLIVENLGIPAERTITIGGSVLGGGNVAAESSAMASSYTVLGNAEVFVKGTGVNFSSSEVNTGGVYGDGYLSLVRGKRYVTLIDFRNSGTASADQLKHFYSIQRADAAVIHNSAVYTEGAIDVVDRFDSTTYSANRIGILKLYAGSTMRFDTVVSRLANLWSDVATDYTFTNGELGCVPEWGGTSGTGEGDQMRAYRDAVISGGSWDFQGTTYTRFNEITLNNGRPLKVANAPNSDQDTTPTDFGLVTGLFTLDFMEENLDEGGAFVYGAKGTSQLAARMEDSPGTFCSINKDVDDNWLIITTRQVDDRRMWYIHGTTYKYDLDLKVMVTADESSSSYVKLWLPVSPATDPGATYTLTFDTNSVNYLNRPSGTYGENVLPNLVFPEELAGGTNLIAVTADIGEPNSTNRITCDFQHKPDDPGSPFTRLDNDRDFITINDATDLIPVKFTLETSRDMKNESGYIHCELSSSRGDTYDLYIRVIVERYDAQGYVISAPGKHYDGVTMQQDNNITSTSAWTADFTTIYSPGTFANTPGSTMSIIPNLRVDLNSENDTSGDIVDTHNVFPRGTEITLVDLTNEESPRYYLYTCTENKDEVFLTDFADMGTGDPFVLHAETALTRERLVFIIDYENADWGGDFDAVNMVTQYLVLKHTRTSGSEDSDILHYGIYDDTGKLTGYSPVPYTSRGVMSQVHFMRETVLEFDCADGSFSACGSVNRRDNAFLYDVFTYRFFIDMPNDRSTTGNGAINTTQASSNLVLHLRFLTEANTLVSMPVGTKVEIDDKSLARYAYSSSGSDTLTTSSFYSPIKEGETIVRVYVPRNLDRGRFAQGANQIAVDVSMSPSREYAGTAPIKAGNHSDDLRFRFTAPLDPNTILPDSSYQVRVLNLDGTYADHALTGDSTTTAVGTVMLWRTVNAGATNLDDHYGSSAGDVSVYVDGSPSSSVWLTSANDLGSAGGTSEDSAWRYTINCSDLDAGDHLVELRYAATKEILTLSIG